MASAWTGILLELSVGQNDFPEKNPAKILMAILFYIVSAMTTILCRRDCLKDPPKKKHYRSLSCHNKLFDNRGSQSLSMCHTTVTYIFIITYFL